MKVLEEMKEFLDGKNAYLTYEKLENSIKNVTGLRISKRTLQWYKERGLINRPVIISKTAYFKKDAIEEVVFVWLQIHKYGKSVKELTKEKNREIQV